jgi:hypothetical protein
MFKSLLLNYKSDLDDLLNKDLPAFNKLLKEKGIADILVVKKP